LSTTINREVKHELINGNIYAMAGAQVPIIKESQATFTEHLDSTSCEPFGLAMKVKTGTNFFLP